MKDTASNGDRGITWDSTSHEVSPYNLECPPITLEKQSFKRRIKAASIIEHELGMVTQVCDRRTKSFTKDFTKDYYTGLKGVYFSSILRTIIRLGSLDRRHVKVLDFGCGTRHLGKLLPGKVIGYDIMPSLTEITEWQRAEFDVVVANEVLYLFSPLELSRFLTELRSVKPSAELIIGISREGILNKILAHLAGEPDAHADSKLKPEEQLRLLTNHAAVLGHASVFGLCDVYHMRLKKLKASLTIPIRGRKPSRLRTPAFETAP